MDRNKKKQVKINNFLYLQLETIKLFAYNYNTYKSNISKFSDKNTKITVCNLKFMYSYNMKTTLKNFKFYL